MKNDNIQKSRKVAVETRKKSLKEMFGICTLKKPVKELIHDIKEGYD